MADIKRLSKKYIAGSLACIAALSLVLWLIDTAGMAEGLMYPMAVSVVFSIVIETADALIWRRVALKSPESLTTFYTAVSAFRMLLALATMLGCYIVVGRDAMTPYVIVMMVYYFLTLAHHSIFFSRLTNGGKLNNN